MDSIIIKPKNKTELNLLKSLLLKMDVNIEVVPKKRKKNANSRPYALSKDKFKIDDSFNEPLPDDLLKTLGVVYNSVVF